MSGLSPDVMLLAVEAHLQPWAEAHKGRVAIASDAFNIYEVLSQAPGKFCVALFWAGDKSAGEIHQAGIVTNELTVIVSHNRGMALWKGRNVVEGRAGQEPLFKLVSLCRARCRSLSVTDPDDETSSVQLEYKSCAPFVSPDGLPLDAYAINFTLESAIEVESSSETSEESGS